MYHPPGRSVKSRVLNDLFLWNLQASSCSGRVRLDTSDSGVSPCQNLPVNRPAPTAKGV